MNPCRPRGGTMTRARGKVKVVRAWAMTYEGRLFGFASIDRHDLSHYFRENYEEKNVVRVEIRVVPIPRKRRGKVREEPQ